MNIDLLIRVEQIKKHIRYVLQIKDKNFQKQDLRRLNNKLKSIQRKIKSECIHDGHYYDFVLPTSDKYSIKKCKICGSVQKIYVPKKDRAKKV